MRFKDGNIVFRSIVVGCEMPKDFHLETDASDADDIWLDFARLYSSANGETVVRDDYKMEIYKVNEFASDKYKETLYLIKRIDPDKKFDDTYRYFYKKIRYTSTWEVESCFDEVFPTNEEQVILNHVEIAKTIVREIAKLNENDVPLVGQFVFFNPETKELEIVNSKDFHVEPVYLGELADYDRFEVIEPNDVRNQFVLNTVAERIEDFMELHRLSAITNRKTES